jgi:hypothetical protein
VSAAKSKGKVKAAGFPEELVGKLIAHLLSVPQNLKKATDSFTADHLQVCLALIKTETSCPILPRVSLPKSGKEPLARAPGVALN